MFASVFVAILGLCYCSSSRIDDTPLGIPQLSGPSEALVTDIAEFTCQTASHPNNETILMQLFTKGPKPRLLTESTSLAGEAVTFTLVIRLDHDGNLECVARGQNNSKIQPTVSAVHYLKVIDPVVDAQISVLSGPAEFFEGQELKLLCKVKAGNHESYRWMLNGQLISTSHGLPASHILTIPRTTMADGGSYVCEATNQCNQTDMTVRSPGVTITVKGVVSAPDISYTVFKEDSRNYFAIVTCQSTYGTPPVDFSLYNGTTLVSSVTSQDRSAVFRLPVVLDQHLGNFQCRANNGALDAHSRRMPLEIVLVAGPVSLHYDYDVREDFSVVGLRIFCKAARGSHPRYQWFINQTLLPEKGSFYSIFNQWTDQSILLLSVGRSSAGTYHCAVSDSFDRTTAINSTGRYLDREVLNHVPVLVVAVVFGCFIFLILLVIVCCGFGVVYRRRLDYGEKSQLALRMKRLVVAYEDELSLSEYDEGAEELRTAEVDDFDQASEASADEWPQIAKRTPTLEDEPAEA